MKLHKLLTRKSTSLFIRERNLFNEHIFIILLDFFYSY